eukprot:6115924-Alexandrium_andersonii.AAC.1
MKAQLGSPFISKLDEVIDYVHDMQEARGAAAVAAAAVKDNREKEVRTERMDLFGRLGSAGAGSRTDWVLSRELRF